MSFNVTLYSNFKKPDSSTKLPGGGSDFSCNIVESCGIINPTISFNQGNSWNPHSYNYARISTWGRYYWIEEWTYVQGRWYATMSVDVLASWKSEILSLDEYVVRSSSQSNGAIFDNRYPATSQISEYINSSHVWPQPSLLSGSYVVGVQGKNSTSVGGIGYYNTTAGMLNTLIDHMMGSSDWITKPEEISDDLLRCLVNPMKYISSIMWFPIAPWSTSPSAVYAGWWNTMVSLASCDKGFTLGGSLGTIPPHPQSGRGSYLNRAPYTEITVELPPFGRISLDTYGFTAGDDVRYQITVDAISGMGILQLYNSAIGQGPMLQTKIGVDLSVGQSTASNLGAAGSAISAVGKSIASTGHPLDGFVGWVAGGIGNALNTINPELNVVGQNGGVDIYSAISLLKVVHHLVTDEDNLHFGRPLCKKVNLGSLSGFCQVEGFDTNIGCTNREHTMIKQLMERGIFIE